MDKEDFMNLVLRSKSLTIDERYNMSKSLIEAFPKLQCAHKVKMQIEKCYAYVKFVIIHSLYELFPKALVAAETEHRIMWMCDIHFKPTDLPSELPDIDKVITSFYKYKLTLHVVPKSKDLYYTLPQWCAMYDNGMIQGYDIEFKQFYGITTGKYVIIRIKFVKKENDKYHFSLSIKTWLGIRNVWQFIYSSNSFEWIMPDDETDIMSPPPIEKLQDNNLLGTYYSDGTIFSNENGSHSHYYFSAFPLYINYSVVIKTADIERLLIGT